MAHRKTSREVKGPSKLEQLKTLLPRGYRFFNKPGQDYFGGSSSNTLGTFLGFKEAHAFARGLRR